jgi:hypothetical protein
VEDFVAPSVGSDATQVNRNDQPIKERGGAVDPVVAIAVTSSSFFPSPKTRAAMGYLEYWHLFDKPFALGERDDYFAAAPQREAMAGLSYFATSPFQIAFLVAPRRCGSSRLMKHLSQMHGLGNCATEVVITEGQQLDCRSVAQSLGKSLGIAFDFRRVAPLAMVDQAIESCRRDGVRVMWMIDRLQACAITTARGLLATHSNLSVVIAATPSQYARFEGYFGDQELRVDLVPLSVEETACYLRQGVEAVGGRSSLFHDNAIVRLHELTGGAIADLAIAAEVALEVAARYRMEEVTTPVVEAACETQVQAAA